MRELLGGQQDSITPRVKGYLDLEYIPLSSYYLGGPALTIHSTIVCLPFPTLPHPPGSGGSEYFGKAWSRVRARTRRVLSPLLVTIIALVWNSPPLPHFLQLRSQSS